MEMTRYFRAPSLENVEKEFPRRRGTETRVRISSGFRTVFRLPTTNSETGTDRSPADFYGLRSYSNPRNLADCGNIDDRIPHRAFALSWEKVRASGENRALAIREGADRFSECLGP